MILKPNKIVLSRTDSIGDVILTLPLAGILKEKFPNAKIIFLGNTYTKPIIDCSALIDEVWEWAQISNLPIKEQVNWLKKQNVDTFIHVFPRKELAQLAKKAKIKNRIGTSHRLFHLLTCNYRPNFTRKNSDLHEAQLNVKLLKPFGIQANYSLKDLTDKLGFTQIPVLPSKFLTRLNPFKINVILHPKSQGSALEWGVDKFIELAQKLDVEKYTVFFTGTEKESIHFRNLLPNQSNIIDLSGKMSLSELVAFIAASDVLVAASTGPLHIAGITNINAIGLFSSRRPIHPGRWKPLGPNVIIFEDEKNENATQPLQLNVRDIKKAVEKISPERLS